jgi:hypothetical protein
MSFGMEMMIMVALLMYILTGIVGIALTVWLIKVFGPFYKMMFKQMNRMYSEMENEEEEAELQRVK